MEHCHTAITMHERCEVGNTLNCQSVSSFGCGWTIPITIPFRDKIFVFSKTSKPVLGLIQPYFQNVKGPPFVEVKWPGREIYLLKCGLFISQNTTSFYTLFIQAGQSAWINNLQKLVVLWLINEPHFNRYINTKGMEHLKANLSLTFSRAEDNNEWS